MKRTTFVMCLLSLSSIVRADILPAGTWVRRDPTQKNSRIIMTVEAAGAGRKITYKFVTPEAPAGYTMTVLTQFDGKDAPFMVDGKPSGQTVATRMIDSRHAAGVVKMNGKVTGTSKSEISPDGKVLKSENTTTTGAGGKVETTVEYWDKQ
jgi:hypothetical protein